MASWQGVAVLALLVCAAAANDDWTKCTVPCKCKWVSGKKAAECSNSSLTTVPAGLSSEIQLLTLSDNSLTELTKDAFYSVGLKNLHKIYLHQCHIFRVNEEAFRGLGILIELDLSNNNISKLHPGTFKDTGKLRVLSLQGNPIQRLENNLFVNLIFLQSVDISNCQLNYVGHRTFYNVSKLQTFKLGGNQLMHIKPEPFMPMVNLNYLVLINNPWHCDCQLKDFYDWMTSRNLTIDASCVEPQSLKDRTFSDLKSTDFECKFSIAYPPRGHDIRVEVGSNITIGCKVAGYPKPTLHWIYKARNVESLGNHHYVVHHDNVWTNLTIRDTQDLDSGTYTCVANGSGRIEERPIRVEVIGGGGFVDTVVAMSDGTLWLILGIVIGLLVVLILVVVLLCCFCRKPRSNDKKGHQVEGMHGSNGDANMDPDQAKSLLVNPVQKPPRRAEMQPLVTNASTTQITVGNGPYRDGSVFLNGSSDEQPLDRSTDSMESQRDENERPDLLSFPSRGSQSSPAGSTASTAPDSHRLPSQHGPQSPVHQYAQSLCSTLPYSRSHSPFTPVIQSRHGYVTIPRRPRVPSWSSMPASSPVCVPGDPLTAFKLEPVYDNLGPRTTADGSSVLSLNKVVDATPMRGRPLPPTPTYHSTPKQYAPIEELELQASPLVARASNRSTPNITAASSPSPSYSNRTSPEGAMLLRREEEKKKSAKSPPVVNGHSGSRNSIKVPPKPPPKPKKKNSDSVLPLFEDEGEDGTEV